MKFRTEIEIPKKQEITIEHEETIVMLGSCFTDNIGSRLERDGFDVTYNPFGPLYNPVSIYDALDLAMSFERKEKLILMEDENHATHCLNFASRYVDADREKLISRINEELDTFREKLRFATTAIITLGTAYVYECNLGTVGNCHKFPAKTFTQVNLADETIKKYLESIRKLLGPYVKLIFTVSPIRHTADTLHGNQLSKASLLLAVDDLCMHAPDTHYFPAYEIMLDDLRDYRFYAADMKHPSEVGIDYIYDVFSQYYFTDKTKEKALAARKESARKAHRQIIP